MLPQVVGTAVSPPGGQATTNLPVLALLVLTASAIVAFVVSLGLLHLYRRRVLAGMSGEARSGQSVSGEPGGRPTSASPKMEVLAAELPPAPDRNAAAESLRRRCMRRPWRAAAVYGAAGLAFALVLTVAEMRAASIPFVPIRFLVLLCIFAWPLVPTIGIVAASTRRAKLAAIATYVAALGSLSLLGAVRSTNHVAAWQLPLPWLVVNLLPSLLLPAVFARRVRAVGPLVQAFFATAFVGAAYAWVALLYEPSVVSAVAKVGELSGLGPSGTPAAFVLLGLAIFGVGGWLLVTGLRRAYERKWASDQSITVDAVWLLFAISGGAFVTNNGAVWILTAPAAFAAYALVAAIGFRLLRRRDRAQPQRPARLLLLRAFSLGRRSEQLYHAVETHWRHVGSIHFIAGPDLATATVEPHEFLDFLRGRLARRFIDSTEALETRLAEMDLKPDLDGRYRVNDFFCQEGTWREVLGRLVATSDLALMDLRGFTTRHDGCAFEIKALVDAVQLERVVILVDESTDGEYLGRVVREGWAEIRADSPNRGAAEPRVRLLRVNRLGSKQIREIIAALAAAATAKESGRARPGADVGASSLRPSALVSGPGRAAPLAPSDTRPATPSPPAG